MSPDRVLIRGAEVEGRIVDVLLADGVVEEIERSIAPHATDDVVDAAGGALIPGLHDHHVHLLAMAAQREGVDVSIASTPAEFDALVAGAAGSSSEDWIRVAGHDEHRHGQIDRYRLDALAPGRRVRVKHRSGLAWVLSSGALDAVGLGDGETPVGVERDASGRATGRLLRLDDWLAERIGVQAPALGAIGAELTALGFTGVTDATPVLGMGRIEALRAAVEDGDIAQRLVLLGVEDDETLDDWALMGPTKIVIDELDDPDPDSLAAQITRSHSIGRPVAIHAVSRLETVTAVMALALAGSVDGDRIEHGSVLPEDLDPVLAAGRITVVVQPSLVRERGDHYISAVDHDDQPFLHRAGSLLAAGVRIAAGSDAPVTSIDPWKAIATAADRTTREGRLLGGRERVDPLVALGWFLTDPLDPGGPIRRVRVGARADLCLLDRPLAEVLRGPDSAMVSSTIVGGRLVER